MKAILNIPTPMVAYCNFMNVDPEEVAQFVLDEHGRECADLLLSEDQPEIEEEQPPRRFSLN